MNEELILNGIEDESVRKMILHNLKHITIPNRAIANFRDIAKRDLKKIHDDIETAKELVLLILSNLSGTWMDSFRSSDERKMQGWKRLYSKYLMQQVKYHGNKSTYRTILDLLIKHKYIEVGTLGFNTPNGKGQSTEYRLTRKYYGKSYVEYQIKTEVAARMRSKEFKANFDRLMGTTIGKNHLMMMGKVQWPTEDIVMAKINDAIKGVGMPNGKPYHNKKGKRLIRLGSNSQKVYPPSEYTYAEDYLKRFRYLRDNMRVPFIREEWINPDTKEPVFRIATCFNMMPSLLRVLLTIEGDTIHENDFSSLFPNIAQMHYGGSNQHHISHDLVTDYLNSLGRNVERKDAKKEHLSFFNKRVVDMKKSILWDYYTRKEEKMMMRILTEKNEHGHKKTAWVLFEFEVKLMTEVIKRCNNEGVDVMYVYDALYSKEFDMKRVRNIMNEVALEMDILTKAS